MVFHGSGEVVIEQLAGDCVDDPQQCQGRGITVSMWMQHGGNGTLNQLAGLG